MEPGGHFHLSCTKQWLILQLQDPDAPPPSKVLNVPDGTTLAEAVDLILADPRTHFVLGECDNQTDAGKCAGHRKGGE